MNDDFQCDYSWDLSIHDVRVLHHCVQEAIKYWPGAPARPYEEQEHMWAIRDNLQRMMLDYQFDNS
jgi:hypothetical protein